MTTWIWPEFLGSGPEFLVRRSGNIVTLIYIYNHQLSLKNKKLEQEARDTFTKLEKGDKKLLKIWERFKNHSVKEFKKTYKEFGISFDLWLGESSYQEAAEKMIIGG